MLILFLSEGIYSLMPILHDRFLRDLIVSFSLILRVYARRLDTNESVESFDIGSRHRIPTLKEGNAKASQPTKVWAVTEKVFDNLYYYSLSQHAQQ